VSIRRRDGGPALVLAIAGLLGGCAGQDVETTYGRSFGRSVNGTAALAEWLRSRGHEVRAVARLDDRLRDRADVLVRFAPYPGPPERREALWYDDWLRAAAGRRLVYICRDYDAEADYWRNARDRLPADAESNRRSRIESRLSRAEGWVTRLPDRPKEPADSELWFEVPASKTAPTLCRGLSGPWADQIDPAAARISRHEVPRVTVETILLEGDGHPLVIQWRLENAAVLVVANGSFLLNASLLEPARRPLAQRLVDWIGDSPRRVVFVDGSFVMGLDGGASDLWPRVPELEWIGAHMLALGLIACLARAVRLGRPRPEPASGVERPSAHAEALGDLLARTGDRAMAQSLLDQYRRWARSAAHPSLKKRAPRP
jgi:hypothetical protein